MVQVQLIDNVLHIEGELGFNNVMLVLNQAKPSLCALKDNSKPLRIDLKNVEHVDSAALALFCSWWRYAKENNLTCEFVHVPQSVVHIAKLLGVKEILGF